MTRPVRLPPSTTVTGIAPAVLADLLRPPVGCRESVFQAAVLALAQGLGWKVASFRPARVMRGGREKYETPVGADGRGWPDMVLVRERVIYAELKAERGPVRPEQAEWIVWLQSAGAEAYILRPSQWTDIVRVLR